MNQGSRLCWLFVQLAAIAAGIYLGLVIFDVVST